MRPDDSSGREVTELQRIRAEYESRSRRIPPDFYALWREENLYIQAQMARACARLLRDNGLFPITNSRIAEIGCGDGRWLLQWLQWGAVARHLHAIDLLPGRLSLAQQRVGNTNLILGNAAHLPWRSQSFDLVTQFLLFSSIGDGSMQRKIAAEMLRVLRPGGHILWLDAQRNNPRNKALRAIPRKELSSLFPHSRIQWSSTMLIPSVARAVARRSWSFALALEKIPLVRTHLVALITPGK